MIEERDRAEVLMHPLRARILEAARDPGSAAELARRLDETPQKVNYHVRRLAEHGYLQLTDERSAGNVVEKVYRSVAESYVLASSVLGGLSPRTEDTDRSTASGWLALQARAETELAEITRRWATPSGVVHAFTMDAEFRFETSEERSLFARALRELLTALVSKYTSPAYAEDGTPGAGRPYRLLLGCYPVAETALSAAPSGDGAGDEGSGEGVDGRPGPTDGGGAEQADEPDGERG